jgi:hypothetical protein
MQEQSGATDNPAELSLKERRLLAAMFLLGVFLRGYCILFTSGTGDLEDWQDHAQQVHDRGLIGYYHANPFANHPPFMSEAAALLLRVSTLTHIPFKIVFRAPFAVLDAANTLLLFTLLPKSRCRSYAAASYWLSPAAIIISSYHGNTDTAVPFFILFSIWLAQRRRIAASGVAIGGTLWIKTAGVLGIPPVLFSFRQWRARGVFLAAALVAALSTYLPALIQDYRIVIANVFGYHGLVLQTSGGNALWGPSALLFSVLPFQLWNEQSLQRIFFVLERSWLVALAAIAVVIWFRRKRRSVEQVCATIGMAYAILFGFSDYWAFQYFAWGLPFWFFLGKWFSIPAVTLTSLYLYSLHALFSGSPWLIGAWDFAAHPNLPLSILVLRNVTVAFFFVSACIFLVGALRDRSSSSQAMEAT